MAFNFVDATHFIPRGLNRVLIQKCKPMMWVILCRHANRDPNLAIILIDPMPLHLVPFDNIRDVLHDFLRNEARVGYSYIQPCSFGQAYVKLNFFHDRDQLILNSLHLFGDVNISFVEHDRGITSILE
jgi:hypothetical protein